MSAGEGRDLHNMSAPPRSTLTLHPFQVAGGAPGGATNWGLAWFARVDLDHLLRDRWAEWALDLRAGGAPGRRPPHLRLCGAVALARLEAGLCAHPSDLEATLPERLGDELLERAPALVRGLPDLLVASRASAGARDVEGDPARVLAVLTHLSGRTCAPQGSPLLSEALREGHALDLWTAEAAHG